jgi:hypothetical protein
VTTEVRTPPHHNTLTCYTDYQCRLPACCERYRRWERNRYKQTGEGLWQPFADAAPVRAHLHALYAAGFTDYRIAHLAESTPTTIHALGKRPYSKSRGLRQRVSQDLAGRILAIDPDADQPGRVPAAGTQRRIQALVAAGWPQLNIAREAGLNHQNMYHLLRQKIVKLSTATAVQEVYERLADKRPERNGISLTVAKRTRVLASRKQWAPVSYWENPDHPIDDPEFEPRYGIPAAQIIAEEARWLMEHGGLNREQVAARLSRSYSYINDALRDYPEKAAA